MPRSSIFFVNVPFGVPDECVQVCLYQFLPHPDSETKPMCQAGLFSLDHSWLVDRLSNLAVRKVSVYQTDVSLLSLFSRVYLA